MLKAFLLGNPALMKFGSWSEYLMLVFEVVNLAICIAT